MYWDRYDIVEAYYCYMYDWNCGGLTARDHVRRKGSISYTLHKLAFEPRMDLCAETLTDNGQEIYNQLVNTWENTNDQ